MHLSKMAFSKAIRQPYYDVIVTIFRNIIIFQFSGFKELIAKMKKKWYDYLINVEKAISHNFFSNTVLREIGSTWLFIIFESLL